MPEGLQFDRGQWRLGVIERQGAVKVRCRRVPGCDIKRLTYT